ncbi:NUDIX hydrolase [Polycladidibacter stylochi]|uniref:NUDIX hydrolase n=1 Tax=Polycladidibacter stylochi TaxID=1807766 RepID=UPI000A63065B|nr:NUDIX hydrolase [Pseudovibrio stylochi]
MIVTKLAQKSPYGRARQYAALPFRKLPNGTVEVLLITSRETKRWIIPKGWPMKNKSGAETAELEAYEEAGVKGQVQEHPIGYYGYLKQREGKEPLACEVEVYGLKVRELVQEWPEKHERERKWFSLKEASQLVHEGELKKILLGMHGIQGPQVSKRYPRGVTRLAAKRAGKFLERIGI